jgi:hypothetical protein
MTRAAARRGRTRRTGEELRLTREERVARGKAARAEVPRSSHAEFAPDAQRPDPVTLLEEQGAARVPELMPIRYGRMAVSRSHSSGAPRCPWRATSRQPPDRARRPGLRRCAPRELRVVRLAGAQPRLRHQRLRRDPARAVGVERQTARGEPRGRRAGQRLLREGAEGDRAGCGGGVPERDAGVRRPHQPRGLVRPHRRVRDPGAVRTGAFRATPPRALPPFAKARTRDNLGALGRFAAVGA